MIEVPSTVDLRGVAAGVMAETILEGGGLKSEKPKKERGIMYYMDPLIPAPAGELSNDHFPTPQIVVRAGVKAITPFLRNPNPQRILDPGAGNDGRWGRECQRQLGGSMLTGVELRNVPPPKDYSEWYYGDFLAHHGRGPVEDLISCNPPFELAQEFGEHSVDLLSPTGTAAMFLRAQFMGGEERARDFHPKGFVYHIAYCVSRIAFIGFQDPETLVIKPAFDVWDYAIFLMSKTKCLIPTVSYWNYKPAMTRQSKPYIPGPAPVRVW